MDKCPFSFVKDGSFSSFPLAVWFGQEPQFAALQTGDPGRQRLLEAGVFGEIARGRCCVSAPCHLRVPSPRLSPRVSPVDFCSRRPASPVDPPRPSVCSPPSPRVTARSSPTFVRPPPAAPTLRVKATSSRGPSPAVLLLWVLPLLCTPNRGHTRPQNQAHSDPLRWSFPLPEMLVP